MSENDKEYFVKDRVLFCNSVFRKEGTPEEVTWNDAEKEARKLFVTIDRIECANAIGQKGLTTIRMQSGNDFVINVPFNDLVKIRYGIEL